MARNLCYLVVAVRLLAGPAFGQEEVGSVEADVSSMFAQCAHAMALEDRSHQDDSRSDDLLARGG